MIEYVTTSLDYRDKDRFRLVVLAIFALATFPCLVSKAWIVSFLNHLMIVIPHEAGHGVMFLIFGYWAGAFGRFMVYFGGSLFQILVPALLMLGFVIQGRMFQAALILFIIAINFVDVSYYAADGARMELPLIFNGDKDGHDWGNILSMTNLRGQADFIGWLWWLAGAVTWGFALFVGYVLAEEEYGSLTN